MAEPLEKKNPSAVDASARDKDKLSAVCLDINTNEPVSQGIGPLPDGWSEATPKEQSDLIELIRLLMTHGPLPGLYLETISSESPENGITLAMEFRGGQSTIVIFGWRPKVTLDPIQIQEMIYEIYWGDDTRLDIIYHSKNVSDFQKNYRRVDEVKLLRENLLEEEKQFEGRIFYLLDIFGDPRNWRGVLSEAAVILIGPGRNTKRRA